MISPRNCFQILTLIRFPPSRQAALWPLFVSRFSDCSVQHPNLFDLVFVANATAGIKLVAEGFSGLPKGFCYKYLRDAHTSLVGASRLARRTSVCDRG